MLMTPEEFACRAVGIPWKRWAASWKACDCFGLVVLYFREVLGIDLGEVPQTDIATGYELAAGGWSECGPEPGACAFMAFIEGRAAHCGVLLPGGMLLHSQGERDRSSGSVQATRLVAMQRIYPDLRFYRYSGAGAC